MLVGCIACDAFFFLSVRTSKREERGCTRDGAERSGVEQSGAERSEAFLRNAAPRRVSLIERAMSSKRVTGRSAAERCAAVRPRGGTFDSIRGEARRREARRREATRGDATETGVWKGKGGWAEPSSSGSVYRSREMNPNSRDGSTRWSCRAGLAGRHIDSLLRDTISRTRTRTRVTRVNWRNLVAHAVAS